MKWKTYNSMSREKQREYTYLFGIPPKTSAFMITMMIGIISSILLVQMFVIYLIVTDDKFHALKDMAFDLLNGSLKLTLTGIYITLGYVIMDGWRILSYIYKRGKWLKENYVYEITWIDKWFKSKRTS